VADEAVAEIKPEPVQRMRRIGGLRRGAVFPQRFLRLFSGAAGKDCGQHNRAAEEGGRKTAVQFSKFSHGGSGGFVR